MNGASHSGTGSNVDVRAGSGSSDGSIILSSTSGTNIASFSSSSINMDSSQDIEMDSDSIYISSVYDVSISAGIGINFSGSFLFGFEKGSGTVSSSSYDITLDKMAGKLTIPRNGASDSVSLSVYNNRITTSCLIFTSFEESPGTNCRPIVKSATPQTATALIDIYDYSSTSCTDDAVLSFMAVC